jgi:hypothetical protein
LDDVVVAVAGTDDETMIVPEDAVPLEVLAEDGTLPPLEGIVILVVIVAVDEAVPLAETVLFC